MTGAEDGVGLLQHHEPASWSFYRYGENEEGEPLFSFWMNISEDTGVCVFDRTGDTGMWLSTEHAPEEYEAEPPSDLLKDVIRGAIGNDGRGVPAERIHDLPDHEEYFFRSIQGTIEQKGKAPEEVLAFISDVVGNEVRIA